MNEKQGIQIAIEKAKKQDPKGQRLLVSNFSDYLYAIAIRYMGDREDARDALQKSWLRILKNIHQYDANRGQFKSWIARITINVCLSEFRSKSTVLLPISEEALSYSSDDFSIIEKMTEQEILQKIQLIPNHYRQVFNLAVIDGYSHKEIGERLNITEPLSRTRLKRAKQLLQQQFKGLAKNTPWIRTS